MCHVIIIVTSEVKRLKAKECRWKVIDRVEGAMELCRCVIEGEKFRGKFFFIFIIIVQFFFPFIFYWKMIKFYFLIRSNIL